ncbi:hypothetical protein DNK10_16485 [Pseudomonas daroniae]|nr:hypothetical protein DNK10_16485 [Pseudomonas daroniae]
MGPSSGERLGLADEQWFKSIAGKPAPTKVLGRAATEAARPLVTFLGIASLNSGYEGSEQVVVVSFWWKG